MRTWSVPVVSLLLFADSVAAGEELDRVIAADRAFADESVERGQLSAFEQFLARDAVVFRPIAVNAQEWLQDHVPPTGRLDWTPAAAAVACDGSMAVTSGPWTYVDMDGRESAAGYYLSLWRKDESGDWRIVLDHGIDVPKGAADASALVQSAFARAWPDSPDRGCGKRKAELLDDAERRFNSMAKPRRGSQGGKPGSTEGVIVYRDGAVPSLAPSTQRSGVDSTERTARSQFVHAAPGSDMGYSYGEWLEEGANDSRRTSVYVRLWQRTGRNLNVILELQSGVPDEFAALSGEER
jgi:ketosteroid isomerase-like protein